MPKLLFILISGLSFFEAYSQKIRTKSNYNTDISFHIGPAFFQGDVSSGIFLSDKKISEMKFSNSSFNVGVGLNHRLNRRFAAKTNLNILQLAGDDKWGKNAERELKFRTLSVDLSLLMEYSLIHWEYSNNQNYRHHIFLSSGVALFYYNPMGKYKNKWYSLRSLGTEGQGLKPGTKKYSPVSYSLPLNFGYRYMLSRLTVIGMEFCFRKTFTDYVDDVSGYYYDNGAIAEKNGEAAAYLADPKTVKSRDGSGRGNPLKGDNYSFMNFTYSRFLGSPYSKFHSKKYRFFNKGI